MGMGVGRGEGINRGSKRLWLWLGFHIVFADRNKLKVVCGLR